MEFIGGGGVSRREMSSFGLLFGALWVDSQDGLALASEFADSNFSLPFSVYIYLPVVPMGLKR